MDDNPYEASQIPDGTKPPASRWTAKEMIVAGIVVTVILGILWALLQPAC